MELYLANTDDLLRGRQPRQESSACSRTCPVDTGAGGRTKRRPRHRGLEDRGQQARPKGLDGGTTGQGGRGPSERPAALTARPIPGPVRAAGDRTVMAPSAASRCAALARPNRRTQSSSLLTLSLVSFADSQVGPVPPLLPDDRNRPHLSDGAPGVLDDLHARDSCACRADRHPLLTPSACKHPSVPQNQGRPLRYANCQRPVRSHYVPTSP